MTNDPIRGCANLREFVETALPLLGAVGLTASGLDSVVQILRKHFGDTWLESQMRKQDAGSRLGLRDHPIGTALHSCSADFLTQLAELASYLHRLGADHRLSSVLDQLKSAQDYPHALLQIHTAARLIDAGATVSLEPPSSAGRSADIEAALRGNTYLAECFVPRHGEGGDQMYNVQALLRELCREDVPSWTVFSVYVPNALDARLRKRIAAQATRLARQLDAGEQQEIREDECSLLVQRTVLERGIPMILKDGLYLPLASDFALRYGEPSAGMSRGWMPSGRSAEARSGSWRLQDRDVIAELWIEGYGLPPDWMAREAKRVFEIINKKAAQARRPNAHRVLVVEHSSLADPTDDAAELRNQIVQGLGRRHQGLISVVFASRCRMSAQSRWHGYAMHPVATNQGGQHELFLDQLRGTWSRAFDSP